ncbi:cytochrome P450 71D10-like protein [Tanacetum coccineum]
MELSFGMFPILSTFIILMLMILKLFKQSKPKLPPGPWKLPIIGTSIKVCGGWSVQLMFLARDGDCGGIRCMLRKFAGVWGSPINLNTSISSLIYGITAKAAFGKKCKDQDAFISLVNYELEKIHQTFDQTLNDIIKEHKISEISEGEVEKDLIDVLLHVQKRGDLVGYGGSGIMFSPYGECWRQLRKICSLELLSSTQVQLLRSLREEEVSKFVKSISQNAGSPINLNTSISSLIYGITAKAAFGKKCKDQDAFISLVNYGITIGGGFSLADLFPSSKLITFLSSTRAELEKIHQTFDQTLNDIIKEHKISEISEGEVEKDLIDVLLHVQKRGDLDIPLSTDNIKAVILEVFIAGSESSSTTLEWAMSELLKNPHIMEKAQAEVRQVFDRRGSFDEIGVRELEFLQLVIKETLRLHVPGPLALPRENKERCELNGFQIPEKSRVIINAWAINRDPNTWDDPESFHPERFRNSTLDYRGLDFKYTPFGGGRRICPGMSFGLANIELPLASLLYHFDWKLADGIDSKDLDMTEVFGITVVGPI